MAAADTLPARLATISALVPTRTAVVDGERRVSYGDLWAQVQAFAAHLRQLGVMPGDRVALVLPNRIEAITATYATWLLGAVAVPLNVQARARDLAPWLAHCGARVVVHEHGHPDVAPLLPGLATVEHAVVLEPGRDLPGDDAGALLPATASPDEPAQILYTSGTTGAPKGVTLTHGNLAANTAAVVEYLRLRPDDSVLAVLPFYYAYGNSVLHTHLAAGACLHLARNAVFPLQLVEALASGRITGFSGVPSTFALLLQHVDFTAQDLPHLRYVTQAGGAMSRAMAGRLRFALPRAQLFVMYGQTEATSRLTWLPPERLDDKPGSVGVPVAGVSLRICDPQGAPLPTGVEGEVEVRGPNVMRGYWRDPEGTARVLRDGWLRTGDIGHLDPEGFLYLAGRRSDMIKTGAHRVHPGDVEEALAEMPGVIEAAVVGIHDEVLGQVIKAFVVARPPPPGGEAEVRAHCRALLAPYKVPRHVEFVDALPRTASGKVRRVRLKEAEVLS